VPKYVYLYVSTSFAVSLFSGASKHASAHHRQRCAVTCSRASTAHRHKINHTKRVCPVVTHARTLILNSVTVRDVRVCVLNACVCDVCFDMCGASLVSAPTAYFAREFKSPVGRHHPRAQSAQIDLRHRPQSVPLRTSAARSLPRVEQPPLRFPHTLVVERQRLSSWTFSGDHHTALTLRERTSQNAAFEVIRNVAAHVTETVSAPASVPVRRGWRHRLSVLHPPAPSHPATFLAHSHCVTHFRKTNG